MAEEALSIVPAKTDREMAKSLRERITAALGVVCELMDEGASAGLEVGFVVDRNGLGHAYVKDVQVKRPL